MANEKEGQRDLVINDGEFAYVQDGTKGHIQTIVGPALYTPSQSDVPVIFDRERRKFRPCSNIEAIQPYVVADEKSYIVLYNPADPEDKQPDHPNPGTAKFVKTLKHGSKVVVPGDERFALWPGQIAEVIPGHDLKSNQYLVVRVYNAEEATKNWNFPAPKPVLGADGQPLPPDQQPKVENKLTIGQLLIIKGTDVSYFIPPTGMEVLKEVKENGSSYIRDALTLEALEYCILRDESGTKRYEIGPAVVFPEPTEVFVEIKDDKGNPKKKARAIELNELQGLYLKVIRDFVETPVKDYSEIVPDGLGTTITRKAGEKIERKAGTELFVTGAQQTIFYPSEDLAFITYDGRTQTFATIIPAGEGRYVLNRLTGDIQIVRGPRMLLPDPRTHIITRRALSDDQCQLWFPGNEEALAYNRELRNVLPKVPTTRAGAVSEGDAMRAMKSLAESRGREASVISTASVMNYAAPGEKSQVNREQRAAGDQFERSSSYTQPRTIQLETKYPGAVSLTVWTGYAIMVVSKLGKRNVVVGPQTVLLDYDESLETLQLSTGKPKNTDNLLRTAYLRVENNKVADIVEVETADHVKVQVKMSYLVNFEGDKNKWFSAENYVKLLCDRARSKLKGAVHKIKIEEFYNNSTDIVRDVVLGVKDGTRPGMLFTENNMRVADVEVLGIAIVNPDVAQMLERSQLATVRTNIELANAQRDFDALLKKEDISRSSLKLTAETQALRFSLMQEQLAGEIAVSLFKFANAQKEMEEDRKKRVLAQTILDEEAASTLARERRETEQEMEMHRIAQEMDLAKIAAETKAAVERFQAAQGTFAQILTALSDKALVEKIAESTNINRMVFDQDVIGDLLKQAAGIRSIGDLVDRLGKSLNGTVKTTDLPPPATGAA